MLCNKSKYMYVTLNNSLSNLLIPSQRLERMSLSLRTRTVLRCLSIQVLNIKSLFPKCLIQSLSLLCEVLGRSLGIYTWQITFLWPAESPGYHQWQQESQ